MPKDLSALRELVKSEARLIELLFENEEGVFNKELEQQLSCPFHGRDSKPSMRYYPESNSCHCFTCKKTWDVVGYIMDKKGMGFVDTLNWLVSRFSINTSSIPDAKQRLKAKVSRASSKRTRSDKVDGRKLLFMRLEERVRDTLCLLPEEKCGKVVHLMSCLRKIEDDKAFAKLATPLVRLVKRYS